MAESNEQINSGVYSENDTLDINELASLNQDITPDLIDQLQNQLTQNAIQLNEKSDSSVNDAELFEEPEDTSKKKKASLNNDIDDNFMKKYKAKLQKQQQNALAEQQRMEEELAKREAEIEAEREAENKRLQAEKEKAAKNQTVKTPEYTEDVQTGQATPIAENSNDDNNTNIKPTDDNKNIEAITGGNIIEKAANSENTEYMESLNYLDGNVKYSKYVIYIDPENKEFIDSLTVKERKNLINRIIKEQDAISMTKRNLSKMQTIITHIIIAIITFAISVPCVYWVVNASLEATIDNYRSSKSMFETLYKQKGKIQTNNWK